MMRNDYDGTRMRRDIGYVNGISTSLWTGRRKELV